MTRRIVAAGTFAAAALLGGLFACASSRAPQNHGPDPNAGPVVGISVYLRPTFCNSRVDCSGTDDCVRAAGTVRQKGVCGVPIDAEGRQAGLDVRRVPPCALNSDCPESFTCLRMGMQDGLCVR